MASVLGLDVGGANLKAAHTAGLARTVPFALWKAPAELPGELDRLVRSFPPFDVLAVTMTGELCDCFASKRAGVAAILGAVEAVARGRPVRVWTNEGQLVGPEEARAGPLKVASANWLALAAFAGRLVPAKNAVLIDVGSTTTDLVPLLDGAPAPQGRTDPERLACGELVYTGARRTPVCAVLGGPLGGPPLAAELFATTLDVYLVLGEVAEDDADHNTADGRPATTGCAHARLARMLCADLETSTAEERVALAERVFEAQQLAIRCALRHLHARVGGLFWQAVLSGEGAFLARRVIRSFPSPLLEVTNVCSLECYLGPDISRAACAHAVAALCQERGG